MSAWMRRTNYADGDNLSYLDDDGNVLVSARLSYVYSTVCERHIVIVTDVVYRAESQEHHRQQWLQILAAKVKEKADERKARAVFLFDPAACAFAPFPFTPR